MRILLIAVVAVLLAGCGGGGSSSGIPAAAPSPELNDTAKVPPAVPVV